MGFVAVLFLMSAIATTCLQTYSQARRTSCMRCMHLSQPKIKQTLKHSPTTVVYCYFVNIAYCLVTSLWSSHLAKAILSLKFLFLVVTKTKKYKFEILVRQNGKKECLKKMYKNSDQVLKKGRRVQNIFISHYYFKKW